MATIAEEFRGPIRGEERTHAEMYLRMVDAITHLVNGTAFAGEADADEIIREFMNAMFVMRLQLQWREV